jgi:hypothetical protein
VLLSKSQNVNKSIDKLTNGDYYKTVITKCLKHFLKTELKNSSKEVMQNE